MKYPVLHDFDPDKFRDEADLRENLEREEEGSDWFGFFFFWGVFVFAILEFIWIVR